MIFKHFWQLISGISGRFRESEDGIIGNFTFKFPPGVGQYYHLPTYSSVVATGQDGLWMTEFKGGQNLPIVKHIMFLQI